MFKLSLVVDIFSQPWKSQHHVPVLKRRSRNDVDNCRAIVKFSVLSTLFEKLITALSLRSFNIIISQCQNGFISKKTTVANLLELSCYIFKVFSMHQQIDVICSEFSKVLIG